MSIPQHVDTILKDENLFAQYAKMLENQHDAYFIGRNLDYASVLEGALKLKEVSYVHADAYVAGELKHGPIAVSYTHLDVYKRQSKGCQIFTIDIILSNDKSFNEMTSSITCPLINNFSTFSINDRIFSTFEFCSV